jgi:hypothetical protein
MTDRTRDQGGSLRPEALPGVIGRKLRGEALVVLERIRNELGQPDCIEQARGDGATAFTSAGIGHNGGPPLDPGADWRAFCWRKAHSRAWRTPPREIAVARLARARAIGMTYRQYTSVLLDRGVHL